MMNCRRCYEGILHEDEVVAVVDGVFRRDTAITHSLDVHDEIYMEHRECFFRGGFWRVVRDIREALQWI